jgi:hypothetical protein
MFSHLSDGRFRVLLATLFSTSICFAAPPAARAQTLWTPWHDGINVVAGGDGDYFNEGYHVGTQQYCIDLNRSDGLDDGSEVLAAMGGKVDDINDSASSGWKVVIASGALKTLYLHLRDDPRLQPGIRVGQYVSVGDRIGILGFTGGLASGPHLHFCHYDASGQSIKPSPFFGTAQHIDNNPTTLTGAHPSQVAGGNNMWHPNGTIIKRSGDNTLWLLQGGQRRGIPTLAVLNAHRLNRYRAIQVSQAEFNAIAEGPLLQAPPAIQLKKVSNDNAIYRISDTGHRQLFASIAAFEGLGYSLTDVQTVTSGELTSHPNDPHAPVLYAPVPDGTVVEQGGTVWAITDGRRRGIASQAAFTSLGYSWGLVLPITSQVLNTIPEITPPIDENTTGQGGVPSPAQLTSPAPNSTLTAATATFTWNTGVGATWFDLNIGSTPYGRDIFDMADSNQTSIVLTGLPTDGRTLYITLWSWLSSQWQNRTYTLTAHQGGSPSGPPALTSPQPGTTLGSTSATFSWSNSAGATWFDLNIGSVWGGRDVFDMADSSQTSVSVSNLPHDGRTLYVTLWWWTGANWNYAMYTYQAPSF